MSVETKPVVITAAVTPLRLGEPLQTADDMVTEAIAALDAGATIVHHHHDFRLGQAEAIDQIVEVERRISLARPKALLYVDYLDGESTAAKTAYLQPLRDAGILSMFAFDPGYTMFDALDQDGLPSRFKIAGFTYTDAAQLFELGREMQVPASIGIYEPGQLRWTLAYARAGLLPPSSLIKLYFPTSFAPVTGQTRAGVGLYPTKESLDIYLSMLDGVDVAWEVAVPGGNVLETPVARYALERGGNIRVGIEDQGGFTGTTNVETVDAAVALINSVGRPIATSDRVLGVLAHA